MIDCWLEGTDYGMECRHNLRWVLSQQSQTPPWSLSILASIQSLLHDTNGPNPNGLVNAEARRRGYRSMGAARKEGWKLPSVFSFLLFSVLQSLRFVLTCYLPHIIQIRRHQLNQCDNLLATGLYQPLPGVTRNDRLYRILTYLFPWGHVTLPLWERATQLMIGSTMFGVMDLK